MTSRFICPHCHSPLDPQTMDQAGDEKHLLRVCPNCDEPVVLAPSAPPTLALTAGRDPASPARAGGTRR